MNFHPRLNRLEIPHIELGTIGKFPCLNRTGPNHDFIEQRGRDASMDGLAKTNMDLLGEKTRTNDLSIGLESNIQAAGI